MRRSLTISGVNKAIIVGHLGKDPKVSTTNSGTRVVSFSVATSETWKDKNTGERKEKTEWHNIAIYNEGLGRIAEQYLKKGSQVYLEGAIRTRKYTAQDGGDRAGGVPRRADAARRLRRPPGGRGVELWLDANQGAGCVVRAGRRARSRRRHPVLMVGHCERSEAIQPRR